MSTFSVRSAIINGASAVPITVEIDISGGIPGITIVGMPDTAVLESRSRVRSALRSAGFDIPRVHATVNLAPSELRKVGTGLDLPIAVALLASTRQIGTNGLDGCLLVGELGLDGSVCTVRGSVAYAVLARSEDLDLVTSADTAVPGLAGIRTRGLTSISELRRGVSQVPVNEGRSDAAGRLDGARVSLDFVDVIDQEMAKRAMVVAATGGHGALLMGPPGAGKTMIARRLPSILPPLDEEGRMEAMLLHSVAGEDIERIALGERPFRSPHHSISLGGLLGGGRPVRPGELSLAHRGVLFLDELPEFAMNVLQSLRQPLEDHEVKIERVEGSYRFPCDFQLIAAANPCPCGHLGDIGHPCTCPSSAVERYQGRIGGPLMDRIDILVDVARPSSDRVIRGQTGMATEEMRRQVVEGRAFARERCLGRRRMHGSSPVDVNAFSPSAAESFESSARNLMLGGRAIDRVARVARTIADLAGHAEVMPEDVSESLIYRTRGTR